MWKNDSPSQVSSHGDGVWGIAIAIVPHYADPAPTKTGPMHGQRLTDYLYYIIIIDGVQSSNARQYIYMLYDWLVSNIKFSTGTLLLVVILWYE